MTEIPQGPQPDVLSFRRLPTADEIVRRLGATSVGYIDSPANGMPGRFDAVVDGQLTRFAFVVDGTNASPKQAAATSRSRRPARQVTVIRRPLSPEVQRAEVEVRERQWRAEAERYHWQAVANLAAGDVAEAARVTGALPAWALSQPAVLTAAARRHPDIARRFHLNTADCASCGTVFVAGDGGAATCRACRTEVER
jgi:hypothetical protein